MEVSIKNGNSGDIAKVDINKRLHVDSIQRTQSQNAVLKGLGFNISTGVITLTSANQSAVFYLKNNEDLPLVFKEILVILGNSTGGSGVGTIQILKNPTSGTIIDNTLAVGTNSNRLFSSARELDANVYKGAETYTFTDGTSFALTSRSDFTAPIAFDAEIIALKKGNSLGVQYTPPTGNTSQTIIIAATVFLESSDLDI